MSLRQSMAFGLLFVGALCGVACVGTDETTDGPTGTVYKYPSEGDFCTAIAQGECNNAVVKACYGSSDASLAADRDTCVSKRSLPSVCRASVTGVKNAPGSYHPEFAEACLARHSSIYSDASITHDEVDQAREQCLKVFANAAGGAGSSCSNDFDCDTTRNLRCVIKGSTGACAEPIDVGGGEDCSNAAAQCPDTFYCDLGGSNACLKGPGEGQACSATKPCSVDFKCANLDADGNGTCAAKLANNADCSAEAPEECTGGFCNAPTGLLDGKCASTLTLAQTSASCGDF